MRLSPHRHVSDHVDPQPRRVAGDDAAIEQVDFGWNVSEDAVERLVEQFEPGDLGIAQVDDDPGALGQIDARLPQGFLEPRAGRAPRLGRLFHGSLGFGHNRYVITNGRTVQSGTAVAHHPPVPSASGKNISRQSAGGFLSVPTLAMKPTNA